MDFVSIEDLAESSGLSRRTVDRKLKKLERDEPEKFQTLVKLPGTGSGTKKILYSPLLLEYLGVSDSIVTEVQQDLRKVKSEVKKERKERTPKTAPAEPITLEVVSAEPVDQKHEKDFEVFKEIIDDWKTGMYTLPECVTRHNLTQREFTYWISTRPAFNSMYDAAYKTHKRAYNDYLRELAKESLKKMVTGYDKAMESVTYLRKVSPTGETVDIPQERKVQQRHVMPNVNAVIFALTNKDPDEWKRVFGNNPIQPNTEQDPLEKMTDADLMQFVEQARSSGLLTAGENL